MNYFSSIVPAGGAVMVSAPGLVLSVKTATGPLTVAFDGKDAKPIFGGTVLAGPFNYLNFFNAGTAAVTVTFFTGDNQVPFSPSDSAVNNSKSYLWGNLGVVTSGSTGGATPTTTPPTADTNGFLQITNGMRLIVAGTRNGARRQVLTLSVDPNAAYGLNVLDPNSGTAGEFAGITLSKGAQIELLTDSDVILSGAGGTVGVTIGQIFLTGA